jgi:UDP-N-acetylglucosamine--N-acetylmuramyl-(pentapeptide) pyrophosphoryl-undecaprenol N-acetylglucosamine transferase
MSLSLVIAAGGTGGHMIPAHALGAELMRRGHRVTLLSDARGLRFPGLFEGAERHEIKAATASGMNPIAWAKALATVWQGRSAGKRIAREAGAQAVIGFGGYPALPGLLAGMALGLPCILHEQNAVLGRVNRNLQSRVSAVALSYADTARVSETLGMRRHVTGNPVRPEILAARDLAYQPPASDGPFNLLVIGGSQGARILSDVVPEAVAALPQDQRARVRVSQQCRNEDLTAVSGKYNAAGVDAKCLAYMADLPMRMQQAHLLISRAGASTMAELTAMGRPAILVPYKAATDDHQTANAAAFVAAGGGFMLKEEEMFASRLSGMLEGFLRSPEALSGAAAAARTLGHPEAAATLADLVEREVRDAG